MTREFLEKLGIAKDVIDSIMAEHGKTLQPLRDKIEALEKQEAASKTTIEGLNAQIKQRDADIDGLKKSAGNADELNSKLTDLQKKYETDTKALQDKLTDQEVGFAAEKFLDGYRFSSKAARRQAMHDFRASEAVKYVDGTFVGGKEFMEKYRTDDPESFMPENNEEGNKGDDQNGGGSGNGGYPMFAPNSNSQNSSGSGDDLGGFTMEGFTYVRDVPKK